MLLLVTAFILLTLALIIYTSNSAKAMEQQLCEQELASVEQTCNNIDYRLEQAAESASIMLSTVYPQLTSSETFDEQLLEYDEIKRVMSELVGRQMITSLRLYVPDTKIYTGQQTASYGFFALSSLLDEEEKYQKGGIFWEPTQTVKLATAQPKQVVSCVIAVRSLSNYEQLAGILFADIDVSQFDEIFCTGTAEDEAMFLVDSNGTILAHRDSARIGEDAATPERMAAVQEQESGYLVEDNEIFVFSKLQMTDWYVMTCVERTRVYTTDTYVLSTITILWIAALLATIIVVTSTVHGVSLSRTISRINSAIHTLESERDLLPENAEATELTLPSQSKTGFPSLERDAEEIVRLIADVVEARYRDRLAASEYQMEALQAQIKPHFLYNTLDVIKWMIMDKNLEDGIWMVNALSKYLRMSINRGDPVVPVEEEISLTRIYLGIMQKRFAGKFRVEYELEDEIMRCRIPKFSLQPLVENALLHGILHCEKPELRLTIRGWIDGDSFNIEIEDNGCGMSSEQAARLSKSEIGANKSYGVANVHKRLSIFAQGNYSFSVNSHEGVGTCVTISLPVSTAPETDKTE
jgi:two-component system sensor histidine kinase YesM